METRSPSPSLWQQTKAFFGSGFWGGLLKGALIGIPIALMASGLFSALPDSWFTAGGTFEAMASFRGLGVQLLFNTIFGAASGSINGGIQAVSALRESTITPQPAIDAAAKSQTITRMQEAPNPTVSPAIQTILERGSRGSASESLLIERSELSSSPRLH